MSRKKYTPEMEKVLKSNSKQVIVNVTTRNLRIATEYQKAHQAALGGHKLTLAEIVSLMLYQGVEKTREQIENFKKSK